MRRKKTKVAISIIIAIVMILLVISTSAEAASFSITSGRDSVTVGESYNITITATGLTGKFNISHSQNVSVNISSVFIDDGRADEKIPFDCMDSDLRSVAWRMRDYRETERQS